jgi:hypothetical protein
MVAVTQLVQIWYYSQLLLCHQLLAAVCLLLQQWNTILINCQLVMALAWKDEKE